MILAFILDNQLDNAKTANSILPEFHRGRLGNEGRPILLKIGTAKVVMWTYELCQSFSFNNLFSAEFWISAPQGSSEADFQCNFSYFSISLLAINN